MKMKVWNLWQSENSNLQLKWNEIIKTNCFHEIAFTQFLTELNFLESANLNRIFLNNTQTFV